jgi:hypothetical protein
MRFVFVTADRRMCAFSKMRVSRGKIRFWLAYKGIRVNHRKLFVILFFVVASMCVSHQGRMFVRW